MVLLREPLELDWGYPGREAMSLALALLADALEGGDDPLVDENAVRLHDDLISLLPVEGWQIYQSQVLDWAYGRIAWIPVYQLPLDALGGGVEPSVN